MECGGARDGSATRTLLPFLSIQAIGQVTQQLQQGDFDIAHK